MWRPKTFLGMRRGMTKEASPFLRPRAEPRIDPMQVRLLHLALQTVSFYGLIYPGESPRLRC